MVTQTLNSTTWDIQASIRSTLHCKFYASMVHKMKVCLKENTPTRKKKKSISHIGKSKFNAFLFLAHLKQ